MSIDEIVQGIGQGFSLLMSLDLLGVPLFVWFIIAALFAIIGSFVKGTKKS